MRFIDAHKNDNPSKFDDNISGGGYLLISNSKTESLVSLSETIDLIDCWP